MHAKIKRDISEFPAFRFDWFIKSRTPIEIGRRCTTLIALVDKEMEDDSTKKARKEASAANAAANGSAVAKGKVSLLLFFFAGSCIRF